MIQNTKYTRKKKLRPIKQVLMASPKEGSRTTYVPVTNAIIIVPMPIMVNNVATQNKLIATSSLIFFFLTNSKP
jgi:hypothetical protein